MFGGKRAFGIFDQKCTLLKTFQISYEVLFRCVQQSPVFFFFAEVCVISEMLRMQKNTHFSW